MNRADRRQANRAWRDLPKHFRMMAQNNLVRPEDADALRRSANRLDRGARPVLELARLAPVLGRVKAIVDRPIPEVVETVPTRPDPFQDHPVQCQCYYHR